MSFLSAWGFVELLVIFGAIVPAPVPTNPRAMDTQSQHRFEKMSLLVDEIHEFMNRTDRDGNYLVHAPRDTHMLLEEQVKVLQTQSQVLAKLALTLERHSSVLARLEDDLEEIDLDGMKAAGEILREQRASGVR